MGLFSDFLFDGYSKTQEAFYSPGVLYEVMSKLGDKTSPEGKRGKVVDLLSLWNIAQDTYIAANQKIPAYALEFHAVNEKGNARDGYGTYVFLPDEVADASRNTLRTIFSEPTEIYDDEDPMKILSALYADKDGFPILPTLTVMELSLAKEEFYPLKVWDRTMTIDPLVELFGVFDVLEPGEFAGVSMILVPAKTDGWNIKGKQRIKTIEDPDYTEEISGLERIRRFVGGESTPEQEAERLAGYTKQQLDNDEKEEIAAIRTKTDDSCIPFRCTLRVYGSSMKIAEAVANVIMLRTDGNTRCSNRLEIVDDHSNLASLALRREGTKPFLITADEVATIWHVADADTIGIKLHQPLPAATRPPDELITITSGGPGDIRYMLQKVATERI